MNKIHKYTNDEKTKEIIYCILFLLLLIVLFLGDIIVLHFIDKAPNPNNTVFGGGEKEDKYTINFMIEQELTDLIVKLEKKEDFILFSSRESCEVCKKMLSPLEETLKKYSLKGYFINLDLVKENTTEYQKFIKISNVIRENFSYTPYLMFFKEGKLQDGIIGKISIEDLEQYMLKYINNNY